MSLIDELATELGRDLASQSLMVTTAESCTGGGIAQAITAIPNSSQWFSHGFVTYSNDAKQQLLNVPCELLRAHGAVSQAVVEAMVEGAISAAKADIAVSVSGIAGPGGGSPEKPVGTVWLAWKKHNNPAISRQFLLSGDRKTIRNQAVIEALQGLITLL